MKTDTETKLVRKYPKLFEQYGKDPRKTCMAWGLECGDGWFDILGDLCEKLSKYDGIEFAQVKEKFGLLRVYINGVSGDIADEVYSLIDDAEIKSGDVCELCGEPGEGRSGGWIHTLCDKCNETKRSK
jgi:hypothetical protein